MLDNSEMDSDLQKSYLNTPQSQFKDLSKTSAKIRPEIISQVRSIEKRKTNRYTCRSYLYL